MVGIEPGEQIAFCFPQLVKHLPDLGQGEQSRGQGAERHGVVGQLAVAFEDIRKITPRDLRLSAEAFEKAERFNVEAGLLKPDETLYVLGITPEMYFWSKRRPPTGVIWSTDMVDNPLAKEHTTRALEDLERKKPEIIIINILYAQVPSDHPVVTWAEKWYRPRQHKER